MKLNYCLLMILPVLSACESNSQNKNSVKTELPSSINSNFNSSWSSNKFWDDGKAEVANYKAERIIYKKLRSFSYSIITVSEVFNKEFLTKTDDYNRKDNFNVMKVNFFARIETDKYPYHFMTSIFTDRNNAANLVKFTNSSQEWCGNTFKEIRKNEKGFQLNYNSYWDTEGSGTKNLDGNILLEDQLIFSLRALSFKPGLVVNNKILETQISSKVGKLVVYNAEMIVSEGGKVLIENKTYDSWKVIVKLEKDKSNEYYFTKEYPNYLIKSQSWDGRTLTLNSITRDDYWNF